FVYFFKNKNRFIWGSEQSGYNHLYLYDYNGTLLQPLTQGDWAVTSLEGVDENKGLVYYVSTEKDLLERQLYVVNLKGQDKTMLTAKEGFNEISMAPHAKYYLDDFSAPLTPGQISMHQADGKFLADVNVRKAPDYSEYNLVMPEYFTIKSDSGLTYHASMIKPPDFDPAKKYPVLVYVYGGPHSQVVAKNFTNPWHQMMAQKGFIVFMMDNRGTANRGRKWETAIYRDLGRIELIDQLRGISYLKSLPYVDANRINIWGWSYGGYMTLYALTHSDVFHAGTAVAPVTDWRYYDSIYTERYMGLPSENEKGYQESAPLNYAGQLKGKLFLAHGSDDDNVHFQNSVQFIHRLIDSDLLYRFQVYPNQSHSIRSIPDRIQLFQSITRFFESVNQPD
ncbi:MAG: prolyl oligopeptidase family serine peptidase, partial [Calditrichia bacterium]